MKINKCFLIFLLFFKILNSSNEIKNFILNNKLNLVKHLAPGLVSMYFLRNEKEFEEYPEYSFLINPLLKFEAGAMGGQVLKYLFKGAKNKGFISNTSLTLSAVILALKYVYDNNKFLDKNSNFKKIMNRSNSSYYQEEKKIEEYFNINIKNIKFILNNLDNQEKNIGKLIENLLENKNKYLLEKNKELLNLLSYFKVKIEENLKKQEEEEQEKNNLYAKNFFINIAKIDKIIQKKDQDEKNGYIENITKIYENFKNILENDIELTSDLDQQKNDIISKKNNKDSINKIDIFLDMQIKKLEKLKKININNLKDILENKSVIFNKNTLKLLGYTGALLLGPELLLKSLNKFIKKKDN